MKRLLMFAFVLFVAHPTPSSPEYSIQAIRYADSPGDSGADLVIGAPKDVSGMQQEKPAPQQKAGQTDDHHQGVVERGDHVMGFSHDKTAHHFRLFADGGAIEAQANDAQDTASRDAIRSHFTHIAKMFAAGDFSAPMLIHVQNPPGTAEMKRLRDAIQYMLENTEQGARIRITTKNSKALQAVHAFLRFQIADHQTGDSTEVSK